MVSHPPRGTGRVTGRLFSEEVMMTSTKQGEKKDEWPSEAVFIKQKKLNLAQQRQTIK